MLSYLLHFVALLWLNKNLGGWQFRRLVVNLSICSGPLTNHECPPSIREWHMPGGNNSSFITGICYS
jgi:hypothetical protein